MEKFLPFSFAIILCCTSLISAERTCFQVEFISFRSGQNSNYVLIDTTFFNLTNLHVNVQLRQTFVKPTWKIVVTRRGGASVKPVQLAAVQNVVCNMGRLGNRNPFIRGLTDIVASLTNFTLTCPLSNGSYYVNIDPNILRNMLPIRVFYRRNTYIHVQLFFYEQRSVGNLTFLAEFFANGLVKSYKIP